MMSLIYIYSLLRKLEYEYSFHNRPPFPYSNDVSKYFPVQKDNTYRLNLGKVCNIDLWYILPKIDLILGYIAKSKLNFDYADEY